MLCNFVGKTLYHNDTNINNNFLGNFKNLQKNFFGKTKKKFKKRKKVMSELEFVIFAIGLMSATFSSLYQIKLAIENLLDEALNYQSSAK